MHRVVSRGEWQRERIAFLKSEKEMQRSLDAFNQRRRELPWERVEQDYRFVGPEGEVSFEKLFGRCSQLARQDCSLYAGIAVRRWWFV